MNKCFGFPKREKLCGVTRVSHLFREGESFFAFPFKVVYLVSDSISQRNNNPELKVLFSVGKRYNKRAVARNLIKRRSREAFRLNKHCFYEKFGASGTFLTGREVWMALIYISKKEEDFLTIQHGIEKTLHILIESIEKRVDIPAGLVD